MHKKKHKLSVNNNSIPIHQTLYSRKYLVFYSIPLASMVALLLLGSIIINPSNALKTNAVTIQDEWVVKDSDDLNSNSTAENSSVDIEDKLDDSLSNPDISGDESKDNINDNIAQISSANSSDPNSGISLMSITTNPTVSLAISKTKAEASTVQGGSTAYATNTITLTGSYVKDYTLSIKAGSANLTMPSGASSSTSTVSGVGTTGVVGSSIGSNKWGYAVTDTSTTNYAGLTYKATPTSATTILSGAGNTESSTSMNVSKQLVFAAKFSSDVTPGTYSASITLSATATPKALTMVNITDMQDMTPEICAASSIGDTATLKDGRDTNSYVIYKASDNQCWMGENLRLTGSKTLKPEDSDVSSNWTLPASGSGALSSDNTTVQIRTGSTSLSNWKNGYGNYYSWCAATANTCQVNSIAIAADTDASSSICPKGWKLPAYDGTGSFQGLVNAYKSSWSTGQTINGTSSMVGYYLGYNSTSLTKGANFWPASGHFNNSGFINAGSRGRYWSRRAYSTTSAYLLYFGSGVMDPQNYIDRYFGFPVRCVAN